MNRLFTTLVLLCVATSAWGQTLQSLEYQGSFRAVIDTRDGPTTCALRELPDFIQPDDIDSMTTDVAPCGIMSVGSHSLESPVQTRFRMADNATKLAIDETGRQVGTSGAGNDFIYSKIPFGGFNLRVETGYLGQRHFGWRDTHFDFENSISLSASVDTSDLVVPEGNRMVLRMAVRYPKEETIAGTFRMYDDTTDELIMDLELTDDISIYNGFRDILDTTDLAGHVLRFEFEAEGEYNGLHGCPREETWVDMSFTVPEPTSHVPLLLGMLGACGWFRTRRRLAS